MTDEREHEQLRAVALQNASSILAARLRAENELLRTKEALEELVRHHRGLTKAALAITSTSSIDVLLSTITDHARAIIGAHQAVANLSVNEACASTVGARSLSETYRAEGAFVAVPDAVCSSIGGDVSVIRWTDASALKAHGIERASCNGAARRAIRGWLAAPLMARDGSVLGVMHLLDKVDGEFTAVDEATLVQLCQLASISLENARLYEDVRKRARHSALAAQIGAALSDATTLPDKLLGIASSIVENLDAALARIWTYDQHERVLILQASAGLSTHTDGDHGRIPLGKSEIGRIGESRLPLFTNAVEADPKLSDSCWARREGMASFAGYPLLVGDELVGVLAMFARHPLTPSVLAALGEAAARVALGIDRDRVEAERAEAEHFRELFIGMLGHDLRNPLSAVSCATDLLEMTAKDLRAGVVTPRAIEQMARTLGRIKNSTNRMARMIDQILDFTRLRVGGGIPVSRKPSDLQDICRDAIDEMSAGFPGRLIDARYDGDTRGSWDADRLSQVFSNLLGNALAYGDHSAPVLATVRGRSDSVEIEVGNEGPPIPSELLPRLFAPFRRARHAKSYGARGLGLGLYITRQIVVAHGGEIAVASAGHRTTFKIRVPRE